MFYHKDDTLNSVCGNLNASIVHNLNRGYQNCNEETKTVKYKILIV
jgi:hypothetical protein